MIGIGIWWKCVLISNLNKYISNNTDPSIIQKLRDYYHFSFWESVKQKSQQESNKSWIRQYLVTSKESTAPDSSSLVHGHVSVYCIHAFYPLPWMQTLEQGILLGKRLPCPDVRGKPRVQKYPGDRGGEGGGDMLGESHLQHRVQDDDVPRLSQCQFFRNDRAS